MNRAARALIAASIVACGGGAHGAPAPDVAQLPACALPGTSTTTMPWHQVTVPGFSYCVPASWHVTSIEQEYPVLWQGADGTVAFGRGTAPPVDIVTTQTVRVNTARPIPPPSCSTWRQTDTIAGRAVDLSRLECQGYYYTYAVWRSPAIYFRGTSHGLPGANEQLAVYRTLRFAAASP